MMSLSVDNPQLLFTLNQPPTDSDGHPDEVPGVAVMDNYLYVVWFNKVYVLDFRDRFKKIKRLQIKGLHSVHDMVGCRVTSQLFLSLTDSYDIHRVNVNTRVCDKYIEPVEYCAKLSLVANHLLVTRCKSLSMFDIHSGEILKEIPYTEDYMMKYEVQHAIESNRNSFFVSHRQSDGVTNTVSEIDSKGRVIRVFPNKEQLDCHHLALDSVGRLLVAEWKNCGIVLLDGHLQFIKILLDKEQLGGAQPRRLSYNKNNNRLAVGLNNGHVKIFECHVY